MPFRSDRQRRFMYVQHPQIARRWSAEEKAVTKGNSRYGSGSVTGRRIVEKSEPVAKRYRDYNPEHRRQRRLGMGEAALIGGGGTAAGFGGHGLREDTKKLRAVKVRAPEKSVKGVTDLPLGKTPLGSRAFRVSGRNAALLTGGVTALGGAAAVRRWAEGNRGRAYS